MCEPGHGVLPSECFVEHIVEGEGRKPLLSADHLRNLHQMVIHDVGQVIGGKLVGSFPQDLIIESVGVDLDMTPYEVVHLHDVVFRHLEADCPIGGFLEETLCLFLGKSEGVAELLPCGLVVDEGLSGGFGFRPLG